jgi:lysyl-tRNA synthetase class 1
MRDLAARFGALPPGTRDGELIQTEVYAAGKAAGFDPLRAWFAALYEVLLGERQGPRFGSFAAIYGVSETIALLEVGAAGALAQAS